MKIKETFNEAIVYADIIDEGAINQIKELCDQESMKDCKIRIMPDCHSGIGCVIGTTMTIKDKVIPNLVGVDIGCGMKMVSLGKRDIDLAALDNFIRHNIPHGKNVNKQIQEEFDLTSLRCYSKLDRPEYLALSLGSLGGGNHFIEIDIEDDGTKDLIIHTGSRNLGTQVANYYQDVAYAYCKKLYGSKGLEEIIAKYVKEGRQSKLNSVLEKTKEDNLESMPPKKLCYLEGDDFENYLHDIKICQSFAVRNRDIIARRICEFLNLDYENLYKEECIHNYIDIENMILRKGSISAAKGEHVIIPINMRDGCILGIGKGSAKYNYSAPHGAGRILSRKDAKEKISLDDFKSSMDGIFSTSVSSATIDESPFAYKSIDSIIKNIKNTVEIEKIIKPIYNFKAS